MEPALQLRLSVPTNKKIGSSSSIKVVTPGGSGSATLGATAVFLYSFAGCAVSLFILQCVCLFGCKDVTIAVAILFMLINIIIDKRGFVLQ